MIIYAITNVENGKRYIGMTESSLARRWVEHKKAARHGSVKTALYNAMRLYGIDRFVCERSDGHRAKVAASWTPERRAKMTEQIKASWTPERRAAAKIAQVKPKRPAEWTPEKRAAASERMAKRLQTPEYRAMCLSNLAHGRTIRLEKIGERYGRQ